MEIVLAKPAAKALRRMPANDAARIRTKIGQLATDRAALANNITQLVGSKTDFRLRVGNYRVIFCEDGTILNILAIAPRGNIY